METFILVVHILIALVIIGLIMLQQGKGAEMGASFGSGSSQTVFGAVGSGNFFSRLTGILVFVFFVTSLSLAVIAKNKSKIDDHFLAPATEAKPAETQAAEAPATADALEQPAAPAAQPAQAAPSAAPTTPEAAQKPAEGAPAP